MKNNPASSVIGIVIGLAAVYWFRSHSREPYYVLALLLLPSVLMYTLGPIAIYLAVRNPSRPKLEPVTPADASIPIEQSDTMLAYIESLHRMGFVPAGNWFRSSEAKNRDNGVVTVLQHHGTTDVATVIAMNNGGVTLGFSVCRSNGTKIRTGASTQRNAIPSNPKDSVVRIKGQCSPDYLWMLHTARVAKDKLATENPPLANPFAYQLSEEVESLKNHLASGYFVAAGDGARIRPTVLGALMMTLRMASPTAQVVEWQERQRLLSILKKLHLPTFKEFKAQQVASQTRQDEPLHVPPGTRTAMA
jgi:hypothetical protein